MREFRGRTTTGDGWKYGSFLDNTQCDYDCYIVDDDGTQWEVDRDTVGQFTGLYDAKRSMKYPIGQPIYEGDVVVRTKYGKEPYAIQFKTSENIGCNGGEYDFDVTGFMPVKLNGEVDCFGDCEYMYSLFVQESDEIEVIGTIYDKAGD